ncbi:hypothetical protein ACWGNA_19790 [Brucella cytisi]|uniref:hypothetical protein n=1 Tax=Brucella cytisi TaxID=407152 RepID=UPI0035E2C8C5
MADKTKIEWTDATSLLPFEATPEMSKAALNLVWEESQTEDDLVCRIWRAMAAAAAAPAPKEADYG